MKCTGTSDVDDLCHTCNYLPGTRPAFHRDWLLIARKGGYKTGGGLVKFYPYEKKGGGGVEKVVSMLKRGGGHKRF